jgi:hypothetical protein
MANYHEEIKKQIMDACKDISVQTAATPFTGAWADHVFNSSSHFIRGKNRGRLPFVSVEREDSDYQHEQENGGTVESTWTIKINVGYRSRKEDDSNEIQAYEILEAILAKLSENWNFNQSDGLTQKVVGDPFGFSIIHTITLRNTYSKDRSNP